MWATDSLHESWARLEMTIVDEKLHAAAYTRMLYLLLYNVKVSCIWFSKFHEFHPHEQGNFYSWRKLNRISTHKIRNCMHYAIPAQEKWLRNLNYMYSSHEGEFQKHSFILSVFCLPKMHRTTRDKHVINTWFSEPPIHFRASDSLPSLRFT